jgi:hypothetical protein
MISAEFARAVTGDRRNCALSGGLWNEKSTSHHGSGHS